MAVAVPSGGAEGDAERGRAMAWLVVAAVSAVLSAAFAAPYGTLNQATYLLDPLHRALPALFRHDWLVSSTPSEQPVFGWLAHWLYAADPEGPTAMLIAHLAVAFATYLALYAVVAAVCRGWRGVAVFVVAASFVSLTMGRAMGGSYLLAGYLQPSEPATLGWIAALAALVRGRYIWCGLALAAAGALHVNFLVLGIGLFTLAALVVGPRSPGHSGVAGIARIRGRDLLARIARIRARDLIALLAPQLAVLVLYLPRLLTAAGPSAEALRILTEFHAPGHYLGSRVIVWIPGLLGWQLVAFVARAVTGGAAARAPVGDRGHAAGDAIAAQGTSGDASAAPPVAEDASAAPPVAEDAVAARALWRFSLVSCAVAVGGGLIICIPAFEWLTQLFWPRVAPFGQLACQILILAALVPALNRPAGAPPLPLARRAVLAAALALALVLDGHYLKAPFGATLFAIAIAAAALAAPSRWARHTGAALAAIAFAAALWASPRVAGLTTEPAASDAEQALYRWVRASTPVDAVFSIPPRMSRFRLLARRAVIADTKSPPLHPDALVTWYHRLCAMVDQRDAPTHEAVEQLWNGLSADQRERIARWFGADYIVVSAGTQLPGERVYANRDVAVYRTQ